MNREALFEIVRGVLVETLGVDAEEVTPQAHFSLDLGGESIDILDFSFRLEKAVGVKIPFQGMKANLEVNSAGVLTEESVEYLKSDLSYLLESRDLQQIIEHPSELFRVDAILDMVQHELAKQKAQPVQPTAK